MTTDWHDIRSRILRLMSRHADALTPDTLQAVRHYVEHGEYELALEGLCIDLMDVAGLDVDWSACIELAAELGLDAESVLDADFWPKLIRRRADGALPSKA